MEQTPHPGDFLLRWRGDRLTVELRVTGGRRGRAALRTNLGNAHIRRREIIEETEQGTAPLAKAWTDIPMEELSPGRFAATVELDEVGIFSAKACFFPEGSQVPEWPEGKNFHIKVESALTRRNNSIYTVFPRQFGSFREVVRRLPVIMDEMGFRIVQTLPPFPVPTTYAVMGEYGCPFASLDFLAVDPAMAEFDVRATPLDQFCELIDAVHARQGLFFVDLPANHTGWASTLQTHHPEWFRRDADGKFVSPGAWGVVWADLVELDYRQSGLREYMAEVFLFWCRRGVDGFRCDAGYMIDAGTWQYIVARVRDEFPDTVFMLEGLGGELAVTDRLLAESNLDWAYSEIFQTYDRSAFEWYLPGAADRAEKFGALVHFAETHDNDRLAKGGRSYAKLRVSLAALLSWQGAWGIANGVEWFCTEKIDVHGRNDLNWGAAENLVAHIARLNWLLETHPVFSGSARLEIVTRGGGNTLAVLRTDPDRISPPALVLANLDCCAPARIEWDVERFAPGEKTDLITSRAVYAPGWIDLPPGEVLCLIEPAAAQLRNSPEADGTVAGPDTVRWSWPDDTRREVVAPAGSTVEISAPFAFRARIDDPVDGRTLAVAVSLPSLVGGELATPYRARFTMPGYTGDGTACRVLRIATVVYAPEQAHRCVSQLLVPPSPQAARVRLEYAGADVRRDPLARTVLANESGAAAQLRLGWGAIASQYDAMLAANPHPECPGDRMNVWARTRCWLQREGYVREFDAQCVDRVRVDPAGRFARWIFRVPCGMGKEAAFAFDVALAERGNAARLKVVRLEGGADDVGDQVRIVFRPDLEWRSFHATTKAYAGAEAVFAGAAHPRANGVLFAPGGGSFSLAVDGGEYHHEPQWTYNVSHAEEARRGQEGAGDLFSPGWISADLRPGDRFAIVGTAGFDGCPAPENPEFAEVTEDLLVLLDVPTALRQGLDLYIVRRDRLKTVIAGYPWFLDWGRDTFIFLRGAIAAGRTDEALAILRAFAAFAERGTLPNIIYGEKAGNRDTSDAQLWFVRCVQELECRLGRKLGELREVCGRLVDDYLAGTPNGICVDRDSALVFSPSHFTWMDTNYPACTPREGYPIEIQALWISALRFLGRDALAAQALESVKKYFKRDQGYADCLAAPPGCPASAARMEATVRPNELLLVTLGVLDDPGILVETGRLLVPGGIRSLASGNPLYRGVYAGDEDTSRKPAYHNGTAWMWPFAQYAEALAASGAVAPSVALGYLASAVDNLNAGCAAHLSEIADGDAPHSQGGCCAQAWSDSELLRVWLKLSRESRGGELDFED